ncbi:hypothetical protein MPH_14023 [Macrophomina phaseolina MS6]|uniref:Uncharacterized protein n=1 Tax=Macrophomina phaseolina (strain MS6) TaxID=1126212 RepID=K2QGY1_MACPH|nr:hypothetical protein MPH_14023 [Macrophomina phaseolina MS6]
MSSCGNGCQDCGASLDDTQQLVQFGPEVIAEAIRTIASSMEDRSTEEFLVPARTTIRCDGSVLLHTSNGPLSPRSDCGKRDAVSYTFYCMFYLLSDYREACREKAKNKKKRTYESFSLYKLYATISRFAYDVIEKNLSYKDCMWRFKEAVEVYVCHDVYWDNNLKDLGRD